MIAAIACFFVAGVVSALTLWDIVRCIGGKGSVFDPPAVRIARQLQDHIASISVPEGEG